MSVNFNADEIVEIAVEIEKNGMAFYNRAAELVEDEQGRKLMCDLAGWEKVHIQVFEDLRSSLAVAEGLPEALDPNGEAALYLQAIADGKVFPQRSMEKELQGLPADHEALLEMAIAREKDAVLFYLAMKDMVPQDLGKNAVYKIIEEEMSHVRFISEELDRVRNQ
ncbi:MAG: hypothetical protein ACYTGH_20445 [Planctomycetota bacterium]|jgi:rubrerythrin